MVKIRARQDSGVYDGDICGVLDDDPEVYLIRWKKNILEIIEEESSQMHRLTQDFREEWESKRSDYNDEELLIDWKMRIRESMELTRDLVELVSKQVLKSMEYSSEGNRGSWEEDLSYIKEERLSHWRPQCNKLDSKRIRKLLCSKNDKREFQWDAMAQHVRKMKRNEYFRSWFRNQLKRRRMTPRVRRYTQSDPEDVFWDWCLGCQPFEDDVDINKAFWNIIMESKRTRKLSEEIGDLPIFDRPDIIIDRCEILEGCVEIPKFVSTPLAYWNVFRAWKHIFREKKPSERRGFSRKCHAIKLKKLLLHTQVETYFENWRHNFNDDFFFKASTSDSSFYTSPNMRISQRLSGAFDHFKTHVNKICQEKDNSSLPYLRKEFEESHSEFCRLRRQVQLERQRSRSFRYIMNEEDWLFDWRWNLSDKQWSSGLPEDSLKYFKEWNCLHFDKTEDNKVDISLIKKKIKSERALFKPTEHVYRIGAPTNRCDFSHLRLEKIQRRKMNRIFAKQPLQRVFCH